MLLWTDLRVSKYFLLFVYLLVCLFVFGYKWKHVQVNAMNILLPFVQKWRLSIAAAAKSYSRQRWHRFQCCTLPKKKNKPTHFDNWCYLKTSVVLFFKLVISCFSKCSCTILYCTASCRLASKLSCDLGWSHRSNILRKFSQMFSWINTS